MEYTDIYNGNAYKKIMCINIKIVLFFFNLYIILYKNIKGTGGLNTQNPLLYADIGVEKNGTEYIIIYLCR